MATNFPGSLDSFTNPTGSDDLGDSVGGRTHSQMHADVNDAIEAMQFAMFQRKIIQPAVGNAARTSRSFAYKGNLFTPNYNIILHGVRLSISGAMTAGVTVKGAVMTVSGGTVATITHTEEFTNPANPAGPSPVLDLLFSSPVTLTAGNTYGLMGGYSSSAGSATSTSDFPLFVMLRAAYALSLPRPGVMGSSVYHIASLAPTVSTAVTTSTNDQGSGDLTYAVFPIFDRA